MPGDLSTTFKFVQVVVLFGVVLALAYFAARLVGRQAAGGVRARHMRLLDLLPLGRDRSLALVEVAGQVLIIGVTGSQVSHLGQIDDPELKAALLATPAPESISPAEVGRQVGKQLKQWLERLRGRVAKPEEPEAADSFATVLAQLQQLGQTAPPTVADRNTDVPAAREEPLPRPPESEETGADDPAAARLRAALKGLLPGGSDDRA